MKRLVASRWFAIADLATVSIGIILWWLNPNLGWRPLLIALLPWIVRVTTGQAPFSRTRFDPLIILFLLTAVMGIWTAYNRDIAWAKFWLLIGGTLLYYSLASQPRDNLWFVAGSIGVLAAGISIYFLLTQDWQNQPADFQVLTRLGQWWMSRRPAIEIQAPSANIVGGTLAMLLPYPISLSIFAWQKRELLVLALAGFICSIALIGLLMTSSRAAWAALIIALGCWWLWESLGWINHKLNKFTQSKVITQRNLFVVILLLTGLLSGVRISNSSSGLVALLNSLPGTSDGGSRLDLYRNSIYLLKDFIFTGGGLGSFAGLYSRYILAIPHFFFGYSHNLYLDIGIEQGLFGAGAFLSIFIGSIWLLIKNQRIMDLHWPILASLLVIGLHGLLDDALYGVGGTPFLFLSIGLALAVIAKPAGQPKPYLERTAVSIGTIGIAFIIILIVYWKPLIASWYADLGAIQMARVELFDFPTGQWEDDRVVFALSPAEKLFNQTLQFSPDNLTANYRLGLIALLEQDTHKAIGYLEKANQVAADHRGVVKNLGYSYVWGGYFDKADYLLSFIPEARNELDAFESWWGSQGRGDLAEKAAQMIRIMDGDSFTRPEIVQRP